MRYLKFRSWLLNYVKLETNQKEVVRNNLFFLLEIHTPKEGPIFTPHTKRINCSLDLTPKTTEDPWKIKPKVSEKKTGLWWTRLRSKPQPPGAPPRTLLLVEWPRGSDRASRYHTQGSTWTRGAVPGETVITENRKRLRIRTARQVLATVLPVAMDRFRYWVLLRGSEHAAHRGSGEGERGLCSVVCGARARGHSHGIGSPSAPNPGPQERRDLGAGFSLGTTAKLNWEAKAAFGAVLGARTRRSPSLSDRQEPGPPPPASPVGLLRDARGIEGRRRSRPYLALRTEWSRPKRSAPLPGCPGPCRWTSGPETGPAWRSWKAGRRWTSSSPFLNRRRWRRWQRQHRAGRPRERPTVGGPGEGARRASPASPLGGPCQWETMTPKISPEPEMLPSPLPTQLRRQVQLRRRWLLPRTQPATPGARSSAHRRKNWRMLTSLPGMQARL